MDVIEVYSILDQETDKIVTIEAMKKVYSLSDSSLDWKSMYWIPLVIHRRKSFANKRVSELNTILGEDRFKVMILTANTQNCIIDKTDLE